MLGWHQHFRWLMRHYDVQLVLQDQLFFLERAIYAIFHVVVSSSREKLGDMRPLLFASFTSLE